MNVDATIAGAAIRAAVTPPTASTSSSAATAPTAPTSTGGSFSSQLQSAMSPPGGTSSPKAINAAAAPAAPGGAALPGPAVGAGAAGPLGAAATAPAAAPAATEAAAPAGATSETGGVAAKRPAPGSYANLTGDLDASPEILGRLEALAAKKGMKFHVTSGTRTLAEQQRLWDNRASNPNPVAPPGKSRHHKGEAADVSIGGRPIQAVISAAELRAAGLVPLAGDPPHVELPS